MTEPLKQFSAYSCKDETTSSMLLPESYIVLSSAQLEKSVSLITRNKWLRKMLYKNRPKYRALWNTKKYFLP